MRNIEEVTSDSLTIKTFTDGYEHRFMPRELYEACKHNPPSMYWDLMVRGHHIDAMLKEAQAVTGMRIEEIIELPEPLD